MRWPATFRLRLRSLFRGSRVEQELDDELQYHLDRLIDENVRLGMRPRQARYAALREMGAIEQRKEECRDARGLALVDTVRQDLAYALRTFRRSPAFTGVAILSLALGIGASTAIFSLWNGLLRAPLPGVRAPEQLVMLTNPDDTGMWTGRWDRTDGPRSWLTWQEFEQLRDEAGVFSSLMASQSSFVGWDAFIDGSAPETVRGRLVSGGYFDVLGVTPAIGRLFTPDLDRLDSSDAVISYAYWQRRFGGRADVLGSRITIRTTPVTIIGVAARDFIGETPAQLPDVWLPARLQPRVIPGSNWLRDTPPEKRMWLQVFGRLKPGVTGAHAEAEANALLRRELDAFYGSYASGERRAEFLDQRLRLQSGARGASSVRPRLAVSLTALLVAVVVLLLIACANLANLLLARGASRKAEIAIRLSLGASRGRILRQLGTESLALAAFGGVAAIPVARMLHGGLVAMQAASDDRFSMQFALDPIVTIFVVSLTFAAALLFGVLPAMQVTKTDASAAMKEQSRGAAGSSAQMRASRLLVCLQIALSLPLLVGAGLLGRTVYNLQRVDLGYPAERLLLVRVDLREAAPERTQHENLMFELLAQLQLIPGVRSVSYSQLGLFSGGESSLSIDVEGFTPRDDRDQGSAVDVVGPGYFSTVGAPMYAGREIDRRDLEENRQVCVINEAFAKQFFAGRNPLGLHITAREDTEARKSWQIVGIVKNSRSRNLRGDVEPRFFVEGREPASTSTMPTFLIRTLGDSTSVIPSARNTIRRISPALAIVSARSIEAQIAPQVSQERTTAQLAVVFGSVALTLAAIGLYGVLSYGVARRTSEIAIRIALGARAESVVSMILRETIAVVAVGLIAGGVLAFLALRLIGSRLYGVAPQDPLTLGLATLLLLSVALVAAYVPALRASRVDPATVLRQ